MGGLRFAGSDGLCGGGTKCHYLESCVSTQGRRDDTDSILRAGSWSEILHLSTLGADMLTRRYILASFTAGKRYYRYSVVLHHSRSMYIPSPSIQGISGEYFISLMYPVGSCLRYWSVLGSMLSRTVCCMHVLCICSEPHRSLVHCKYRL